ncbi:hypothetical protein ACQ4PT_046145 [Festuca glaucescens]
MASPTWKWKVTYSAIEDLNSGRQKVMDGELHLWTLKDWIALMNYRGAPIVGKFLVNGDVVDVGTNVEFPCHHVKVVSCILSPAEVRLPIPDLAISAPVPLRSKSWKISYSTSKDLNRGRMNAYDGTLVLLIKDNWLILNNAKGSQIGCRYIEANDSFSLGAKLSFPVHVVRMGAPISRTESDPCNLGAMDQSMNFFIDVDKSGGIDPRNNVELQKPSNNVTSSHNDVSSDAPVDSDSFALSVHASLILGLSFSHGNNFAKDVRNKFHADVHPSAKSGHFMMTVSFGRANFKMEEDLVSIALEAVIGGYCGELKVSLLRDRVFSFCVSNKAVGFHILKLRKFSCTQFKCFFHLWGRGGPNWKREFYQWQRENDAEWTLISPTKQRLQRALLALRSKAPKSILSSAQAYRKRLMFAEPLSYSACLGYQDPKAPKSSGVILPKAFITEARPKISFGAVQPFPFSQQKLSEHVSSVLCPSGVSDQDREAQLFSNSANQSQPSSDSPSRTEPSASFSVDTGSEDLSQQNGIQFLGIKLPPFTLLKRSWLHVLDDDGSNNLGIVFHRPEAVVASKRMIVVQVPPPANSNVDVLPALAKPKKSRRRKTPVKTPIVQPEGHRFTRSCLKKDGYRPAPVLAVQVRPMKKTRAKLLIVPAEDEDVSQHAEEKEPDHDEPMQIPATPIAVMQRVGRELGIDPAKLTKEQLEAVPSSTAPPASDDE